jgi:hypothetical protein
MRLKTVRGAAAGRHRDRTTYDLPEGLLVVHPGDADLIRGLLESAVQFAEPADPIRGYKTYSLQGQAWATVTTRLFLVARKREALVDAVARLHDPKAASLATNEGIKSARPERAGAMIFVYVDGPRAAQEFRRRVRGDEASIAAGVLDLDHLKAISAFVRASDEGLQVQARLDLKEGHRNLAYALIRTAPCERTALEYVPGGTAAVALLGLNPAKPVGTDRGHKPGGRLRHRNGHWAGVLCQPAGGRRCSSRRRRPRTRTAGPPMPRGGCRAGRQGREPPQRRSGRNCSRLPAVFLPRAAGGVSEVTIEGTKATEYRYSERAADRARPREGSRRGHRHSRCRQELRSAVRQTAT